MSPLQQEGWEAPGGPPGDPGLGGLGGFGGGGFSPCCGRGWGYCRGAPGGKAGDKEWIPMAKLGHLVKDMKIKSLEEIYLFSLPIKDFFLGVSLKDKVLKIMPMQKQIQADQHTRFKAFVAIGDYNSHVGLSGVKCSKEVATAIRGAIILANLFIIPVQRSYWANKIGKPHTVLCKETDRQMRICAGAPHPRTQRHWDGFSFCPQEVIDDGWC
ncbi:40S ribosomal protein S2-like [Perognathus longimembris pacificus]|uniref:40S ribosomal protein S2-like n=1 Tax=Perognathus longimembris pacificus TaxID=214514 RepID=UPI00201996AE|nr:40S ribosomal protein S2-like [Perognathus longimembris pacificus]